MDKDTTLEIVTDKKRKMMTRMWKRKEGTSGSVSCEGS